MRLSTADWNRAVAWSAGAPGRAGAPLPTARSNPRKNAARSAGTDAGSALNRWYSASRNSAFQALTEGRIARGAVVTSTPVKHLTGPAGGPEIGFLGFRTDSRPPLTDRVN